MTKYVAFLRGINIGGRKVRMEDLQKVFEQLRFTDIRTLIASGNVVFSASETDEKVLQKEIEATLEKTFGFTILVILRTIPEIEKLVKENPFARIATDSSSSRNNGKGLRLQITLFLNAMKSQEPIKNDKFMISILDSQTLASVVYPGGKTTDLMTYIDKNFGKNSTTRNWNTILKLFQI